MNNPEARKPCSPCSARPHPDPDSCAFPQLPSLPRRQFLSLIGTGAATMATGRIWPTIAGPFDAAIDHFIPVDKKLKQDWIASLFAKGQPTWYQGTDLRTIGMPIGGICAGQVYLSGDGRLIYWDIFNQDHNTGYGRINYKAGRKPTEVASPDSFTDALEVLQGFALRVRSKDREVTKSLDQTGFPQTRFNGEYPLGRVAYVDDNFPVSVTLEAFSPFVPLDPGNSSLPATLLRYTVRNTSKEVCEVSLGGWLENKVCAYSAKQFGSRIRRTNRAAKREGLQGIVFGIAPSPSHQPSADRPPLLFADFEQGNYGDWKATGEAFGSAPATGTLPSQQGVSGFQGKGLVNTYLGGNDLKTGKLTSPPFSIERPWISFLIGGGSHASRTCLNLVIDGEVVATATGRDNERLEPKNWSVEKYQGRQATLEIVDAESVGWGHVNVDHIEFRDHPVGAAIEDLPSQADYGSMALVAIGADPASVYTSLDPDQPAPGLFAESASEDPATDRATAERSLGGVRTQGTLRPGESLTFTFAVTWCFPHLHRGGNRVGNHYAAQFHDAMEVAQYLADNLPGLVDQTQLWHDTYYDSTLPYWLLDRLQSTVSTLATRTCQWWENGRFWAWEGCGCCHGTCGHVWNYEHALARMFPSLERSVREQQDFSPGVGLNRETGSIGFRGEGWALWAGDAQGGYILKAYREHCCSPDDRFLRAYWPAIRQAMDFLIQQDGDDDGLIRGRQHQTYDQDYYGANTMVGSLYLGALRAAEEMALEMNDPAYAKRCRDLWQRGSRKSVEELFNGEYFIQQVDLSAHPEWQYGQGCLADQLFGQGWAHQVNLGYLYPKETVQAALLSIWKYCWAPDIHPQNQAHAPERWFARAGEAGLFTCTWPKTPHLGPKSTRYRNEVWTGIEYQVANHLAWEGMLTEALAICRAIHDRYHPEKRNPWNEIECGDHYARAMASWGVLISLSGFTYHGPSARFGFAPRLTPDNFKSAFTAAEGWGSISQQRSNLTQQNRIEVRWGTLTLRELTLESRDESTLAECEVLWEERPLDTTYRQEGTAVTIRFGKPLVLQAGQSLKVSLRV